MLKGIKITKSIRSRRVVCKCSALALVCLIFVVAVVLLLHADLFCCCCCFCMVGIPFPNFYRAASSLSAEVDTSTYDVVGGQSHDGKDEVYYSAVTAPPTTGEGKGFTLSKCPAYGPVIPPGPRGERREDQQPVEYEVVQTTSSV